MTGYRGRIAGVAARDLSVQARMHNGTRLVGSQGRTVRGLSVRRHIGTRTYQAHRHIGTSRLSGSQGRTVRDLSAHKRIGMRLVGSSSKVQAPVGQQYDASVGVRVRGRHAVGCEPSGQTGGQMPVPFLSYRQTEPVMSSNLAASSNMATRYTVIAI